MSTEFYWIAVAVVTILSAARITRLAVYDEFPPVKWLRNKYVEATDPSDWSLLGLCGYCFSFWATGLVVCTGLLANVYGHPPNGYEGNEPLACWWILNGIFAASYLAAAFVANDGDDS